MGRVFACRMGWDRWLMMVIIGVAIGLTAVLMRQCLDALDRIKWDRTREYASVSIQVTTISEKSHK